MVGVNSQASTVRRPKVNKTTSKQKWGDKNPVDIDRRMQHNEPYGPQMNNPMARRGVEASPIPLWIRSQQHVLLLSIEPQFAWTPDTETREKLTNQPESAE